MKKEREHERNTAEREGGFMWMGVMSVQNESVILMITSRLLPQGEGGNEGTITDNGKKTVQNCLGGFANVEEHWGHFSRCKGSCHD